MTLGGDRSEQRDGTAKDGERERATTAPGEREGIPGARQDTSYYLAGGVRAGFEWAVATRLSLRAWADARAPVAPVRLQVQAPDGEATVWQSPAVAVSGGLGLAAHFR